MASSSSSSSSLDNDENNTADLLLDLLQDEKWNDILDNLRRRQQQQQQHHDERSGKDEEEKKNTILSFSGLVGLVLSTACSTKPHTAPIEFFHGLLGLFHDDNDDEDDDISNNNHNNHKKNKLLLATAAVNYQDPISLDTALHMAVLHHDGDHHHHRPDIVQLLVSASNNNAAAAAAAAASLHEADSSSSTRSTGVIRIQDICNAEGLRPIDILTQRILMKEERLRYYRSKRKQQQQQQHANNSSSNNNSNNQQSSSSLLDLDDCWESARILAMAHAGCRGTIHTTGNAAALPTKDGTRVPVGPTRNTTTTTSTLPPTNNADLPLLHACCLAAENIPLSLFQRALRRSCGGQSSGSNSSSSSHAALTLRADAIHGNTPLHCLAAAFRPPTNRNSNNNDALEQEQDDDSTDNDNDIMLGEVLRREPRAAGMLNHDEQYPLDLAISAGRTWQSGACCRMLLEAHPAAILHCLPSEKSNKNDNDNDNDDDDDDFNASSPNHNNDNDTVDGDKKNHHDDASSVSLQSKLLLTELFSKKENCFDLTYSILHVVQPQLLFE